MTSNGDSTPDHAGGPEPVVSVILLTYNHEPFIAESLYGILNQQTDFDVELFITEDCSTDATMSVIEEVQAATGAAWTLMRTPKNECSNRLWRQALDAARGEFIATLDGDDYWTDPHKLARQVALLRGRPDCSMCFHDVDKLDQATGAIVETTSFGTAELNRCDLILGNHVPGCSPLIRRSALADLPPSYDDAEFGDWPLYLEATAHGPAVGVGAVMGVYRLHNGGIWTGTSVERRERQRLSFLDALPADLRADCRDAWRASRGYAMREIATALVEQGRNGEARRMAVRSIAMPGLHGYGRRQSLRIVERALPSSVRRAIAAVARLRPRRTRSTG